MSEIDNQILHSGVIDERAQLIGGWLNPVQGLLLLSFFFFSLRKSKPAKFNDF